MSWIFKLRVWSPESGHADPQVGTILTNLGLACGAKRRTPFSFGLKSCRIEF